MNKSDFLSIRLNRTFKKMYGKKSLVKAVSLALSTFFEKYPEIKQNKGIWKVYINKYSVFTKGSGLMEYEIPFHM